MEERVVTMISLSIAIVGFITLLLYLLTVRIDVQIRPKSDTMIAFQGEVIDIQDRGNTATVRLGTTCVEEIFVFKDAPLGLHEGSNVSVLAKQEEFDGEMLIVAHRIEER